MVLNFLNSHATSTTVWRAIYISLKLFFQDFVKMNFGDKIRGASGSAAMSFMMPRVDCWRLLSLWALDSGDWAQSSMDGYHLGHSEAACPEDLYWGNSSSVIGWIQTWLSSVTSIPFSFGPLMIVSVWHVYKKVSNAVDWIISLAKHSGIGLGAMMIVFLCSFRIYYFLIFRAAIVAWSRVYTEKKSKTAFQLNFFFHTK